MLENLKRIIKFGFQSFSRHKGLSLQVIFIMVIAVFSLSSLLIFGEVSSFLIGEAQRKVDVSVYFSKGTAEEEILKVKEELFKFSEDIREIEYISRTKARDKFLQRHGEDTLYLKALDKIGGNPFLASLDIKASNPGAYAQLSDFLSQGPFKDLVEKVSYFQNEEVINKLFSLTEGIKKGGLIFSGVLIVLVFLITFNTIKLTIFALKDEISTMKLVGASDWFIKGPFLIQGLLYGLFSLLIVDILLLLTFGFLSADLKEWLFGFDLLNYFGSNLPLLILWQILFSLILGGFSSYLAVRKYLKI